MANEQNLIPQAHKLTVEEQSRAGKRSGEVRRARKTLREELLLLLSQGNVQEKIILAMIDKCLKGDTKAYEVIRDTIGEKPKDQVENLNIETTYEDYINKVADEDEY